jgi:L-glyceraldehyde 3-phosphate reductase
MKYNRCGRSGLLLPAISLGLWHSFGNDGDAANKRAICRKAFDFGITHFDLANNYGPPPGSAESAFGEILRADFSAHRDEMVISTKAGYQMWDGPHGEWGSRKHVLSSLDQSLKRLGLPYVDIFYSHRFDPDTPLEETMGALSHAVRSGRALYVGISNYPAAETQKAGDILRSLGTPCLIHQPQYNMLHREPEMTGVFEAARAQGMGVIAFSPLAQGVLTNRYFEGIPADSRATHGRWFNKAKITEGEIARLRKLNDIAASRGQTLAQMAIAWVVRGGVVTSALMGASQPAQVADAAMSAEKLDFSTGELAAIEALLA